MFGDPLGARRRSCSGRRGEHTPSTRAPLSSERRGERGQAKLPPASIEGALRRPDGVDASAVGRGQTGLRTTRRRASAAADGRRERPRRQREAPPVEILQPTLGQTWPPEYRWPQYAFKMSMFNVSCNSH